MVHVGARECLLDEHLRLRLRAVCREKTGERRSCSLIGLRAAMQPLQEALRRVAIAGVVQRLCVIPGGDRGRAQFSGLTQPALRLLNSSADECRHAAHPIRLQAVHRVDVEACSDFTLDHFQQSIVIEGARQVVMRQR